MVSAGVLGVNGLHLGVAYLPKVLIGFGAGAALMLAGLARAHPYRRVGAANQTTIVRAGMVALLAGLLGEHGGVEVATAAAVLAASITLLDGVDGWLARRYKTVSGFGARFDMETDAVFVAVLSLLAWQFGKVGGWVLLSGLMRYLFAIAAVLWPLLRRPVPSTYRAKSIAVFQMIALIIVIAPASGSGLAVTVAAAALIALIFSFSLDVVWLVRQSETHDR
jgi:phosphatidylglycerophosphate synthase